MLLISVPIAMLVTRSRMISTTTGTRYSAIHSRALANAGWISSGLLTRIALQPRSCATATWSTPYSFNSGALMFSKLRSTQNSAEHGGQRPSERARLPAIDPMPRLLHAQKLRRGDQRQPDRADVAHVVAERLVHLAVDALRLDRHLVVIGAAQQRALALAALVRPHRIVRQRWSPRR